MRGGGAALTMLCLALTVQAQPTARPQPAEAPQSLRQRQALINTLLGDSPAAHRIETSQNAEAKRHYAQAKDLSAQAAAAAAAGEFAQAEKLLNESMWQIGRARQLVPDNIARAIGSRVRYAQLQSSIDSLLASYRRHGERCGRDESAKQHFEQDMAQVQAQVDKARDHATAEHMVDAVRALERAEQVLLRGLNRVLGAATLDYAQSFETPAQEYTFELERNRSYRELVPVALDELKPSPDARSLIERYVEQNRLALQDSGRQAERGDHAAALKALLAGTGALQRALSAAGLVMPQETK